MKELTKKVIEAGLVPKHALQMMEKWKMLDPSEQYAAPSKEDLENRTQEQLTSFTEEIAELLEDSGLPECRETDMTLTQLFQKGAEQTTVRYKSGPQCLSVEGLVSVKTRDGRRVLRRSGAERYVELAARPGNQLLIGNKRYEIRNVEVRYVGDVAEFYSCAVREMDDAEV